MQMHSCFDRIICMKQLREDLKNRTFAKVYLLYGEEDYLRCYWYGKLKEALDTNDSMNVRYMNADSVTPESVRDFTETMPFFADRRVLFLDDTGIFAASNDTYAGWLSSLPDTACVVCNEKRIDKRNKLFKEAAAVGLTIEFSRPSAKDFENWVLKKIGAARLKIGREAFRHLIETVDHDMEAAANELDKLFAYVDGREVITAEDIDAIVTVHLETRVFDLVEAVARGQRRRSMDLYYGLLSMHEAPGRILYYIGRQFHQMLIASSMREKHASPQDIMQALNISDFVVRKIIDQSRRFSVNEIKDSIDRCVSLEAAYKTGDLADSLAVELFIFELTENRMDNKRG